MTPSRVRQRKRILRARKVNEQIAHIDHLAASVAEAEAAALAVRLSEEIARCALTPGSTSGQMLAARAALADRLVRAVDKVALRQSALSASEKLAAQRRLVARISRRSAEMLTERATNEAEAAADRRLSTPYRKQEKPR
jgi:hypothetical protein